jgi:hypothetical protein
MINKEYFLHQIDQYMRAETQGYGDSTIATKYVWERLRYIMDNCLGDEMADQVWGFMEELAHNYQVDTDNFIGEDV